MTIQITLILILAIFAILLSVLLITRIRREKKQLAALNRVHLHDFADFLKTNSTKSTVVDVTKKISDLLIGPFGCKQIFYLSKKRNVLEINYHFGLRNFNKSTLQVEFCQELGELLKTYLFPRSVDLIRRFLPSEFYDILRKFKIDVFFPVFWRDNLYGIYFIRSTVETQSPSFNLLIACLAQSLSAAYHIQLYETNNKSLQNKLIESPNQKLSNQNGDEQLGKILKLVRHRNTETIVPHLIDTFKKVTGMSSLTFIYEPINDVDEPMLINNGVEGVLKPPGSKLLNDIIKVIEQDSIYELEKLKLNSSETKNWIKNLKDHGLKYIASFPLSPSRGGLLVWQGNAKLRAVKRHLNFMKSHTFDLIENAFKFEKIEELSYTDNLTGLANHRYFFKRLDEEINRARRYKRKLALVIFDMDSLKQTNDTYGHLAGDALLSQMGDILRKSIRTIDIIARYGGDEFCVIMPEANEDICLIFMERLKSEIYHSQFAIEGSDKKISCTVSMGGAIFPDHAEDSKKLVFAADMALLKAKETGRNKSLIFSR